jgi:hypothetical protein
VGGRDTGYDSNRWCRRNVGHLCRKALALCQAGYLDDDGFLDAKDTPPDLLVAHREQEDDHKKPVEKDQQEHKASFAVQTQLFT